ncbi:MAG: carboxypeptidase-like regulatory domain-containing protein [Bacteroidota bacterium]|jgi:hypothetical protein
MNSKKLTFLFLLTISIFFGQTNNCAIKIIVQKKSTKDAITDSLFISLTSTATTTNYRVLPNVDGETMLKLLYPNKYAVTISVKGYQTQRISGVIIGEAKTAYVCFALTSIDDLKTKKRRRQKI